MRTDAIRTGGAPRSQPTGCSPTKREQQWSRWAPLLDGLSGARGVLAELDVSAVGGDTRDGTRARPLIACAYLSGEDVLSVAVSLRSGPGTLRHTICAPNLVRVRQARGQLVLVVEDGPGSRTTIRFFNVPDATLEALPPETNLRRECDGHPIAGEER